MNGLVVFGAISLFACHAAVWAKNYPSKPVRWVVTYPAGGVTDAVARLIGGKLSDLWKQPVVIDNRGGAGGVIGTELVGKSPPDGYTLLFGTSGGLSINPALSNKLPYDPVKDFAPVSLLVISPHVLLVNPTVPARTVKELVALAKAKPGQLNYASVGPGSPNQLGMELFKSVTGTDIVHVPYKGTGPAIPELIAGRVQMMLSAMPSVLPLVKAGRLTVLGVASTHRSRAIPDVPTLIESGIPDFQCGTWNGLFAPARTPRPVINIVNSFVVKALSDPE
ncbi:MAG TPA: tripartite tricarboxylate transporter substrate binding protein, partial [Burkholderiales bacterium]|nr:tripartite tricarboxylate transporter substrate binding protein [Burkholderiales bacterium]